MKEAVVEREKMHLYVSTGLICSPVQLGSQTSVRTLQRHGQQSGKIPGVSVTKRVQSKLLWRGSLILVPFEFVSVDIECHRVQIPAGP